jgi:murein DD-endopeptidase MepM/ murein hydrolase activator NlpD
MHLSWFTVRVGQRVRGGQLIGYVGDTGMKRDRAHLHFELRVSGRHINPVKHLGPHVFSPRVAAR